MVSLGIFSVVPSYKTMCPEVDSTAENFFFSSIISNQSIRYSMSWCAGCLSWWGPLQRDLCRGFSQLLIHVWLLVSEVSTLNLILLTTQTMVTTGILPLQGKIPMVEPGIEPGTSWLVVRSSDHQTTRLVSLWKWVPGISPGVKAAVVYGWRPTTLVVPNVEMIRGLNLPGTPRATSVCRGTPLLIYRH